VKHQGCYINKNIVNTIVINVQLYLSVVNRRTEMLATGGV